MIRTHKLKLSHEFADQVHDGSKTFELRLNDRGYQRGDLVQFQVVRHEREIEHELNLFKFEVTYVTSGWGLKNGYVAFGIRRLVDGVTK